MSFNCGLNKCKGDCTIPKKCKLNKNCRKDLSEALTNPDVENGFTIAARNHIKYSHSLNNVTDKVLKIVLKTFEEKLFPSEIYGRDYDKISILNEAEYDSYCDSETYEYILSIESEEEKHLRQQDEIDKDMINEVYIKSNELITTMWNNKVHPEDMLDIFKKYLNLYNSGIEY